MTTDPQTQASPDVDHPQQFGLAALFAALLQPQRKPLFATGNHVRSGVTKNKSQPRNKQRVRMAKESRRRNRA